MDVFEIVSRMSRGEDLSPTIVTTVGDLIPDTTSSSPTTRWVFDADVIWALLWAQMRREKEERDAVLREWDEALWWLRE